MTQRAETERRLVTTRQVTCHCFARADGLWDIEGTLVDTRAVDIPLPSEEWAKAQSAIHEMRLRLTIDLDRKIHHAEVTTLVGAMPACAGVGPDYRALEGLVIGAGFGAKALALLGGERGCTHLTELLGRMASAAYVALFPSRVHMNRDDSPVGGCRSWRAGGEAATVAWPRYRQVLRNTDWTR